MTDMDADKIRFRRWQSETDARLTALETGSRVAGAAKIAVTGNTDTDKLLARITYLEAKTKAMASELEKLHLSRTENG